MQVQLTVEEALEFQKFQSWLDGFQDGVQTGARMMADRMLRARLDQIIASRPKPEADKPDQQ